MLGASHGLLLNPHFLDEPKKESYFHLPRGHADRKWQSQRFELGYLVLGSVHTQVAALVEARSMIAPCPWGLVSRDKETDGWGDGLSAGKKGQGGMGLWIGLSDSVSSFEVGKALREDPAETRAASSPALPSSISMEVAEG